MCTLNTLIPQVVDPAQPPINISNKKNIKGKFPGAESYIRTSVSLPIYYSLTKKNIYRINGMVRSVYG